MTPEEFLAEIRRLALVINNDRAIGDRFDVAKTTVERWKSGSACPLPRMRKFVIEELKEMIGELNGK